MPTGFKYTALDGLGHSVSGMIEAPSRDDAFSRLNASGLVPTMLERAAVARPAFGRRVSKSEAAAFTRELSVLVQAKIPIAQGIASIAETERNPAMSEMIRSIAVAIESGMPLSDALRTHATCFDEAYVESIRAAESSGTLEQVTEHLADMMEHAVGAQQRLRRALTYPIVVLIAAVLAMGVITIFVVPRFAVIFESNGVELPLMTRLSTSLGSSVQAYWPVYVGGAAVVATVGLLLARSSKGAVALQRLALATPILGTLLIASTTARFGRLLSISLSAGLDVVQAIDIAGKATGSPLFAADCSRMAERLRVGDAIGDAMRSSAYLPDLATRLLGSGKESTELARACDVVSRHYEREAEHRAASMSSLVEPLMTVLLACVVLTLALSVFMPMWQLMQVGSQ